MIKCKFNVLILEYNILGCKPFSIATIFITSISLLKGIVTPKECKQYFLNVVEKQNAFTGSKSSCQTAFAGVLVSLHSPVILSPIILLHID